MIFMNLISYIFMYDDEALDFHFNGDAVEALELTGNL